MQPLDPTASDMLMLSGVSAACADCGGDTLFVPVDDARSADAYCCTSCDAAVFLLTVPVAGTDIARVA